MVAVGAAESEKGKVVFEGFAKSMALHCYAFGL
jgi:hypothetical protein